MNSRIVTHMGMDCHRTFSTMSGRDKDNQIVWRGRLDHVNRETVRKELRTWSPGMPVVLEGTFGWGWMSEELKDAGLEPHLASGRKVAAWRRARGLPKTNRRDADLLSELWPQQPRWWEVWLAPREVRDQREWLRHRMSLVRTQTGLKNRIHAVLHRHGIVHGYADLFGSQGRRFLTQLVGVKDERLSESGAATLKNSLQLLDHVRRQIAGVTREMRRQVKRTPAGERLRTLPGISWILAYTILAEVGQIERFASAKHLASYSLLAPMADDSGEPSGDAPIGRHVGHLGRRTLKWAWIEAAHSAIRKSPRLRAMYDRRTNTGTRDRNRGCILVAHELCRLGYVVWTKEVDYMETPPPRPGQRMVETSTEMVETPTENSSGNGPARRGYGRGRRQRRLQTSL